jgi:hypothetical protein
LNHTSGPAEGQDSRLAREPQPADPGADPRTLIYEPKLSLPRWLLERRGIGSRSALRPDTRAHKRVEQTCSSQHATRPGSYATEQTAGSAIAAAPEQRAYHAKGLSVERDKAVQPDNEHARSLPEQREQRRQA